MSYRLVKFLRWVIKCCPTPTCVWPWKHFTGDEGGIRTHDLLRTRAYQRETTERTGQGPRGFATNVRGLFSCVVFQIVVWAEGYREYTSKYNSAEVCVKH